MNPTNDLLRTALKADAGPLPTWNDRLLPLPLREGVGGEVGASSGNPLRIPAPRPHLASPGGGGIGRALVAANALAACVVFGFLHRSITPGAEGLSDSIAAVTAAARPPVEFASLPMQPYRQNLALLNDDARRLGRFVASQLDVLPQKAPITNDQ